MKKIIFIVTCMMVLMSAGVMGALNDSIVSSYKCDTNGSFPDSVDSNDGVIAGATFTTSGKINGAYSYDGINDHVSLSSPTGFGRNAGQAFTWQAWIKTSDTNKQVILLHRPASTPIVSLEIEADGTVRFQIKDTNSLQTLVYSTGTTVDDGAWHHIVAVYDPAQSNEMILYIDTTAFSASFEPSGSTLITASGIWFIGRDEAAADRMNGTIDEISFWSRALSASEVIESYNSFTATLDYQSQSPSNGSEYAYSSTGQSLGFDFNITGGADFYTCNLTRNGTLISSNAFNATLNGTFTLYDTYNNELNYTEYEYGVVCSQDATTITDTNKTIYVLVDTTQPTINFIYPKDGDILNITGSSLSVDISASLNDTNLYNSTFTLLWENGSIRNKTNVFHNLSGTYYQWNLTGETFFPEDEQNMSINIYSCDGHTKQIIDEWGDIGKTDGSIVFGDCRIYPDSMSKDIGDYGYRYEGDRFVWWYDWLKSDTTRSYFLECPAGALAYLPQSSYKGHFVDYSKKRWIDFETAEDYDTAVAQVTDTKWKITYYGVPSRTSRIETESIGELNCKNETITFRLEDQDGAANVIANDTTPLVNDTVLVSWNYTDNNNESINFSISCGGSLVYENLTAFSGSATLTQNDSATCTASVWGNDTLGQNFTDSTTVVFSTTSVSPSVVGDLIGSLPTDTREVFFLFLLFAICVVSTIYAAHDRARAIWFISSCFWLVFGIVLFNYSFVFGLMVTLSSVAMSFSKI